MKNLNKEKVLTFVKENKAKAVFLAAGLLVVLVLIINGLLAVFGVSINKSEKAGYNTYDIQQDEMMGNKAFVNSPRALSKSFKGMPDMIYPESLPNEGRYDGTTKRKIIKNGNISMIVKNIKKAKSNIEIIVKKNNGFIQNSNFSENENYRYNKYGEKKLLNSVRSGSFTLKVPSNSFEKTFSELKKIALKVKRESTSGSDVTEQFADLETQIKNKKAEVDQYRKILAKAEKVEDILKVTQYLNSAQSQYERLQGRMNRLSNQIEMSTIYVDIVSEKDIAVFGVTWSPLLEIKQGFSNMVGDLKDFANDVIAFVFKLPIYILYIGGVILALRLIWKLFLRLKKKVWKSKK